MTYAPVSARPRSRAFAVGLVTMLALAACSGGDDDDSEPSADPVPTVDAAETERADDAEAEADSLATDLDSAEADLDAETELEAAEAARADAAEAEVDTLTSELETAQADLATTQTELDTAQTELDTTQADLATTQTDLEAADAALAESQAQVTAETQRADTAEAEVARFTNLFPVVVESTLEGIELEQAGTYNLAWTEAYCDTFTTCGTLPVTRQASFVQTPDDFLRVTVAGILDAGLFSVDGSLYGITDSLTALPPCPDGTPRRARITITTYANNVEIDADGNRSVTGLEGSITVDAPNLPGCDGGLVFYGIGMTRVG